VNNLKSEHIVSLYEMKYQNNTTTFEMMDIFKFPNFQVFFCVYKQQFLATLKHLKIFSKFSVGTTEHHHLQSEPTIYVAKAKRRISRNQLLK